MNRLVTRTNRNSQKVDQNLATRVAPESPATPHTRELTAEEQVILARAERKADIIRTLAFPAAMATAIPVGKDIGAAAFKVYQDRLLREAGSPTNPVEIMLLEQLSLAHLRVAQLHAQAELAKSIEETKVCSTAATRLTGEVRRLALALKAYREPGGKRQFTVVRQQNVSAAGQQVAYLDQSGKSHGQIPFLSVGGEQRSRRLKHAPQTTFIPQSQAASSRAQEPPIARPVDSRGTRAFATGSVAEPAVEVLDRAENGGR